MNDVGADASPSGILSEQQVGIESQDSDTWHLRSHAKVGTMPG